MVQINKYSTPNVRQALCIIPVFLFVLVLTFFLLYLYCLLLFLLQNSSPRDCHYVSVILASHSDSTSPLPPHLSRDCFKHPDFQTRRGHFVFNYVESTSLPLPSTPHFIFVFSRFKFTFPRLIMLMISNSITADFVISSFAQVLPRVSSPRTALGHFYISTYKNIILNTW